MKEKKSTVKTDTVSWLYLKLSDMQGSVLYETEEEGIPVLIGHEDILPVIEKSLLGKKVGEKLCLHLEPETTFGDYDPELLQIIDSDLLGDHVEPGMQVEGIPGMVSDGRIYTITDVTDDKIILDGNHPLAGIGLVAEIKIIKVEAVSPDEIELMDKDDSFQNFLEVPQNLKKSELN